MRPLLAALALLLSTAPAPADDPLVTPAWLLAHAGDANLVLLHVGPATEYETAHIPGARHVTPQDLAIPKAEGALILQLLPPEALRAKLESYGISDGSRVVVYFGKDWVSPATRVVFSLAAAGLGGNVSLLDGGMPAWEKAGGKPTKEKPGAFAAGKITAAPRPGLVAGLDAVKADVGRPGVAIVDARSPQYYDGKDPGSMPRAGHIPGARNIPFTSLVGDDLAMKSPAETAALFAAAGIRPGDTVVSYCHIGQQATVVWFAAERLGHKAEVYDGSWDEWSRKSELPVETGRAAE